MQNYRVIEYQNWLSELKGVDSKNFLREFGKLLDYIVQNNESKVNELISIYNKGAEKLKVVSEEASFEILPLLKDIKQALDKKNAELPYFGVVVYELAFESKPINTNYGNYSNQLKVEVVYYAIRLALEKYVNDKTIPSTDYEDILSIHNNYYYLDSDKFKIKYPTYNRSMDYINRFDNDKKEKAWGAMAHLDWIQKHFGTSDSKDLGYAVKEDVISNLKTLMYFLNTKKEVVKSDVPNVQFQIIKLFSLSSSPYGVRYEGINTNLPKWKKTKGRTQTYSLLNLAHGVYQQSKKKNGIAPNTIKLSYMKVYEYLSNSDYCDRQPNWKGTDSNKRRLDLLHKNTNKLLGFSGQEFSVQGNGELLMNNMTNTINCFAKN